MTINDLKQLPGGPGDYIIKSAYDEQILYDSTIDAETIQYNNLFITSIRAGLLRTDKLGLVIHVWDPPIRNPLEPSRIPKKWR